MGAIEDMIWEKAAEDLYIGKAEYMAQLATWEIEPVERCGTIIGAVLRRGAEFHFATFGATPRIGRDTVRDVLAPQLAQFGYVTTKTPKPETRQHRFNRAVGFVAVGEDEFNIHYRLDRDRSAVARSTPRSMPCPQQP